MKRYIRGAIRSLSDESPTVLAKLAKDPRTRADTLAEIYNLPNGGIRHFDVARALASNPKLLLLDEPAAGMNPQETEELMNLIAFIRKEFNLTILLIEHDMSLVMNMQRLKDSYNYMVVL